MAAEGGDQAAIQAAPERMEEDQEGREAGEDGQEEAEAEPGLQMAAAQGGGQAALQPESIVTPRSISLPGGGIFTLNEVRLVDRTRAGNRTVRWLLQIELEKLIWGGDHTNGAMYKLLARWAASQI